MSQTATNSNGSKLSDEERTVLVVEDEVFIRMNIADYLRDCGFWVLEATNADDALATIKNGQAVHIVFSDVQMPGELDGFGLARWIRANRPDIRVILTSGMVNAAAEAGDLCDDGPLMTKPYLEQHVLERIQQILGENSNQNISS